MPIYEYRCASCGHQQESLQKVSDAPLTQCPKCNQPSLAKMVTAAGFQLKGSGWYATDFKGKGASTAAKPDGAKPEAGKSDAGKSDAGKSDAGKSDGGKSDAGGKGGESKGEPKAAATAGCGGGCACH